MNTHNARKWIPLFEVNTLLIASELSTCGGESNRVICVFIDDCPKALMSYNKYHPVRVYSINALSLNFMETACLTIISGCLFLFKINFQLIYKPIKIKVESLINLCSRNI